MSNVKECINCQVLGMQKYVDRMIMITPWRPRHLYIVTALVGSINDYIESDLNFREHADYKLELVNDGEDSHCRLVSRKTTVES